MKQWTLPGGNMDNICNQQLMYGNDLNRLVARVVAALVASASNTTSDQQRRQKQRLEANP